MSPSTDSWQRKGFTTESDAVFLQLPRLIEVPKPEKVPIQVGVGNLLPEYQNTRSYYSTRVPFRVQVGRCRMVRDAPLNMDGLAYSVSFAALEHRCTLQAYKFVVVSSSASSTNTRATDTGKRMRGLSDPFVLYLELPRRPNVSL